MVGYLFLGAAFGILLESKGYGFGWAALMSVIVYAGSMQFVAVDLLATGAGFLQVALMTLMVNIRHVFYGLSLLGKFQNFGAKKPYMIFSLSDETFSLLCSAEPPKDVDRSWFFFLSPCWTNFTGLSVLSWEDCWVLPFHSIHRALILR